MDWMQSITNAIRYMENNLTNDISIKDVSKQTFVSGFHFGRVFTVVTGITIGDYIRNRRLSLAGLDLLLAKSKIIDIAMRYQYDTSESFSKAFTRFHGFPPSVVKTHGDKLKCFDPITINIFIQGGFNMERKIMENENGVRLIREKFEYKNVGNLRYIGLDTITKKLNLSYQEAIEKTAPLLEPLMSEYAYVEIPGYCSLEYFQGQGVDEDYRVQVFGKFFKAKTPVPEGLYYLDIPSENIGHGIYSGDESFGGDPFDGYVFTRDQILSDGIAIPFPENFWSAMQFIDGEPVKGKYRFGYMFGVGELKLAGVPGE